jgi:hypothetical protein
MILFTLGTLGLASETGSHVEMHAFLALAKEARDATIQGDLEGARAKMKGLTQVPSWFAEYPEPGRKHLVALQSAAEEGAEAPNLEALGRSVTRMAAACGACHTAIGGGPSFKKVGKPPTGAKLEEHMQLHAWAAERMWEGLVVSDAERWKAGARVLYEESWVHSAAEDDPKGSAFALHVHEAGMAAVLASNDVERAALYGQFLASCAGCHSQK